LHFRKTPINSHHCDERYGVTSDDLFKLSLRKMNQKRLLLVEDEAFVAMDVQMTFEDEGWNVAGSFPRVSEALAFLTMNLVDCAILDMRLMDGEAFPVADRLMKLGIPFIFHSGHANAHKLKVAYPGTPFVGKPALPIELVDTANALIRSMDRRARA
jgi:DNA-binding response OmpR family regulator